MVNYKKDDLMMFVDAVGHVAMATFVENIDGPEPRIRVKNPLWVSLVPRQDESGKVRVALETPAWGFRDFFADHNDDQMWDVVVSKYSFYEGTAFSDLLKLHYYNSFARIENGVKERLDKDGNKLNIPEPPPMPPAEAQKKEEPTETPDLKPQQ